MPSVASILITRACANSGLVRTGLVRTGLAPGSCADTPPTAPERWRTRSHQAAIFFTVSVFVAIFPLLLVAIAVIGFLAAGDDTVATRLVDDLGLTGTAAARATWKKVALTLALVISVGFSLVPIFVLLGVIEK